MVKKRIELSVLFIPPLATTKIGIHMKAFTKRQSFSILIGNILEHYDRAIYGLLAPFIAPLFFPSFHPITALLLAYLPLGFITRPLGALFFGYVGDHVGRKHAFFISILGISITVFSMGLIPTFKQVGAASPIILYSLRGMICFFAAGECTAAPLLLIENAKEKRKTFMSSFYEMSSILGTLLASFLVTIFCFFNHVETYWRWFFIISGTLGISGFFLRKHLFIFSSVKKRTSPNEKKSYKQLAIPTLAVIFMTGFSCANYNIILTMMNGYLPLVSSLTKYQMVSLHSSLILLDLFLLPLFAFIAIKVSKEKLMLIALSLTTALAIPLFMLLKSPTLLNVLLIRCVFVILGICIAAPFQHWTIETIPESYRFRILSLAKAFGAQWIGGFSISLSLLMYQKTHWIGSPAILIAATAMMALTSLLSLQYYKRRESIVNSWDSLIKVT